MEIDKEKYPDRKFLKWIAQPGYTGWQFSFERPACPESKFFNIKKSGSVDAAYRDAIAYRDKFLKAAAELGLFDENANARLPIVIALSPRNTSGIVGVHRSSRERPDRKRTDVNWISTYKNKNGVNKQKKFSILQLGEKQALYRAINFRRDYVQVIYDETSNIIDKGLLENHIIELEMLMEYVNDLNDEADVFFFLSTINNPLLENTEKQDMLAIRIGQHRFRKLVLEFWESKCAVTGSKLFLTAAHIKPWCVSNNHERLDVFNGLALSPLFDKAFDAGFISFADDGKLLMNDAFKREAHLFGVTGEEKIEKINHFHHKYLEYHRDTLFKR